MFNLFLFYHGLSPLVILPGVCSGCLGVRCGSVLLRRTGSGARRPHIRQPFAGSTFFSLLQYFML